jgi:oligopeptide transport system ATP-binding protein
MSAPVLDIADLAVYFAGKRRPFAPKPQPIRAVDGVSLSIQRGETLGLVGESGCGKSTLANAVLGLVPATGGNVLIKGKQVVGADRETLRDIRAGAQMIFQDPALSLNPRLSVGAAVGEPLLVRGHASGRALEEKVAELLVSVGLRPEHASRFPHQFSGGQRQRIVIARALALSPDLVICDEAVSALDVSVRAQVLNLLARLQRERRLAYLFVSHDLAVVRHVCDRIAVMYLGRIVELATCESLFANPRHPYTRALMQAVPVPDPAVQRARPRAPLAGELPSPSNVPKGCAFNTRCPLATDLCRAERPELGSRGGEGTVACHHV